MTEPQPLVVSEVFGPTLQGEGPSVGTPAAFVRLGGCNLSCGFCDTAYTWDWQGTSDMARDQGGPFSAKDELERIPAQFVADKVCAMGVPLLVVTGGEPMLQASRLGPLLDRAMQAAMMVEVETNGTIPPSRLPGDWPVTWNVSPKLALSGDPLNRRIDVDVLREFAQHEAAFKFVARVGNDLRQVDVIVEQAGIPADRIWVMPLGRGRSQLDATLGRIAPYVIERGWRLTTRMHIHAWGDRRGV